VLENRSYAFNLTSGAIIYLRPGANPVQGELKEHYGELEKDHYFKKYVAGGILCVVEDKKDIPWALMPPEIREAQRLEEAERAEELANKKIQEKGQREFQKDIERFNKQMSES